MPVPYVPLLIICMLLPFVANVAPLEMFKREGVNVAPAAGASVAVPEVIVKDPVNVISPVRVVVFPPLNVQGFATVNVELAVLTSLPPPAVIDGVALPRLAALLIDKVPEVSVRPPEKVLAPERVAVLLDPALMITAAVPPEKVVVLSERTPE